MEVVAVRRIVVRADHPLEEAAGTQMHLSEKGALVALSPPAVQNGDLAAVGEGEARYVDGVAGGMFAAGPRHPVVAVAAGVGAPMIYPRDGLPEVFQGRRLEHVCLVDGVGRGKRAGGDKTVVESNRGSAHLDRIDDAAAVLD